jgi:S-adenosylmethionine:tRNA ribosyltransferase-isomerase
MNVADFDYHLPPELIAQTPIEPRDSARLMVVDRARGTIAHRTFRDVGEYLRAGDVLVLNDTRVLPARLHAHKLPTGGRVELLLLRPLDVPERWEVLVRGHGLRPGTRLALDPPPGAPAVVGLDVRARVEQEYATGERVVLFERAPDKWLERLGEIPLPPYIHTPLADPERYQTVFARTPGAAAAPTAGLHFTPDCCWPCVSWASAADGHPHIGSTRSGRSRSSASRTITSTASGAGWGLRRPRTSIAPSSPAGA